jgi:hypothetical protein
LRSLFLNPHTHIADTISTRPYKIRDRINGRGVFLVDTPGFDDTSRSDAGILKEISFFLATLRARSLCLSGLIYLHRISDARMSGSAIKNLRLFQSLCGEENYGHVTLATTMWSDDANERPIQKQRLEELRDTFWAEMVRGGCLLKKHRGDQTSALNIVRDTATVGMSTRRPITLAIQHELGVEGKTLDATAAGKLLSKDINGDRERAAREFVELQLSLDEAERDNDGDAAELIRHEQEVASAHAAQRTRDLEGLRLPVSQLAEEQRPRYQRMIANLQQDGHIPDKQKPRDHTPSPQFPKNTGKTNKKAVATENIRPKRSRSNTHHGRSGSPRLHKGGSRLRHTMASKSPPPAPSGRRSASKVRRRQEAIELLAWLAVTKIPPHKAAH